MHVLNQRTTLACARLEDIRIDGRPGWGWLETHIYRGEVASLELKAVVPYDTVTYAVEFYASHPEWVDEARLREVMGTFAVGRTELNVPLLALVLVVLLAGGALVAGKVAGLARSPGPGV